jgi:hypothetical protein
MASTAEIHRELAAVHRKTRAANRQVMAWLDDRDRWEDGGGQENETPKSKK